MVNECCVNVPDPGKYNPEDSLLRRNQKELLVILKDLAEICDRHGICWWLSSGTLLGAARNNGFIPWDDDIDIVMPRKEFKRLRKILMAEENDKKQKPSPASAASADRFSDGPLKFRAL